MLNITNLNVSIDQKPILRQVNLVCQPGTTHVIMGSNGSGKSSLAHTLIGHPYYTVTGGALTIGDQDITHLSPDKRAQLGLFLSFQHPYEIPGLRIRTFLKEAYQALHKKIIEVADFEFHLTECIRLLTLDPAWADRNVNEGFSGGEKKKFELLQMLVLEPSIIILDEIDSGLDVDAVQLVHKTIALLRHKNPATIVIVITHYQRLLSALHIDYVHVMSRGTLVATGDRSLITTVEECGYQTFQGPSS